MLDELQPIQKLERDVRAAAKTLSAREARYLVDLYYTIQDQRIRAGAQAREMSSASEPHETLSFFLDQSEGLEGQIKRALDAYSLSSLTGEWAREQIGIGPVLAAGLLAHIDIRKAPTAGHIWSFAGLNPNSKWEKGQKRPWNAALKVLCWKIGESFVKTCTHEDSYYGKLYTERKLYEVERNERGENADAAAATLTAKKIGKDTDARLWLSGCFTPENAKRIRLSPAESRMSLTKKLADEPGSGVAMLPPAQLHARAKRWAVKLFLAHYHHVAYAQEFGKEPPLPYPIAHLGHAHYMKPPGV